MVSKPNLLNNTNLQRLRNISNRINYTTITLITQYLIRRNILKQEAEIKYTQCKEIYILRIYSLYWVHFAIYILYYIIIIYIKYIVEYNII